MDQSRDLRGQKFGRLTIVDMLENYKVKCICDCGNEKIVAKSSVITGKTKSCGCLHKEAVHNALSKDISGKQFGRLTVVKRSDDNIKKWVCKCECGNMCTVTLTALKCGYCKSCGCLKTELSSERFLKDITGRKFGKLTVIKRIGSDERTKSALWLCNCECGNQTIASGVELRYGRVNSCGCIKSKNESAICNYLSAHNIMFSKQYRIHDCKYKRTLPFDFAIFNASNELECLIEHQGSQHYTDGEWGKFERDVSDGIKKNYCLKHNIALYEITYNEHVEDRIQEILTHTSYANIVPSFGNEEGVTTIP